jgi:putative FmdB family regulatory protein
MRKTKLTDSKRRAELMPLYDYECSSCGTRFEQFASMDSSPVTRCPNCDNEARRIISCGSVYVGNNDDTSWAKSCVEVMDREDKTPAVQEFLKNPTKSNLKKAMAAKGLRHLEPGEKPIRREPPDLTLLNREIMRRHRKRMALSINTRR